MNARGGTGNPAFSSKMLAAPMTPSSEEEESSLETESDSDELPANKVTLVALGRGRLAPTPAGFQPPTKDDEEDDDDDDDDDDDEESDDDTKSGGGTSSME